MFPIALVLAFCRGLFDLSGVQTVGYLVQYASLGLLAAAALLATLVVGQTPARPSSAKIAMASVFLVVAGISWVLTVLRAGVWEGVIYLGVMAFWTFYLVAMGLAAPLLDAFPLERALLLPLLSNLAVGALEQSGRLAMPGSSLYGPFVRPAGLTGSMQHYTIAVAMGAFFSLQVFLSTKRPAYLVAAFALILGTMTSLTRSGYLIVGVTLALVLAVEAMRASLKGKFVRRSLPVLVASALSVLLAGAVATQQSPPFRERLTTMLRPEAPGNPERLVAWRTALEMWLEGPFIVGDAVGIVTQSTAKVFASVRTVNVESGLLQQLVNFGLLGTIAFYAMLLLTVCEVDRRHGVLRAVVLASILQSTVYMSVETVPYMFLLGLAPVLSRRLLRWERRLSA